MPHRGAMQRNAAHSVWTELISAVHGKYRKMICDGSNRPTIADVSDTLTPRTAQNVAAVAAAAAADLTTINHERLPMMLQAVSVNYRGRGKFLKKNQYHRQCIVSRVCR